MSCRAKNIHVNCEEDNESRCEADVGFIFGLSFIHSISPTLSARPPGNLFITGPSSCNNAVDTVSPIDIDTATSSVSTALPITVSEVQIHVAKVGPIRAFHPETTLLELKRSQLRRYDNGRTLFLSRVAEVVIVVVVI